MRRPHWERVTVAGMIWGSIVTCVAIFLGVYPFGAEMVGVLGFAFGASLAHATARKGR